MSIKLVITGDFCPIMRNTEKVEKMDISIFGDFFSKMNTFDYCITNLEAPITSCNNKIKKTGPNLKSSYNALKLLQKVGFNLVTLANNHILDYGEDGLIETISNLNELKIEFVGAGKSIQEARKPYIINKDGYSIGILNFAENEFCSASTNRAGANPVNIISNYYDIRNLKEKVDYVIVIVHGGREHYPLPPPKTRERYRFYADCGADLVVGHHTHCYSGYEKWNDSLIFYSLGNFIFDYKKKYRTGLWTEGFGLELDFNSKGLYSFSLIPYYQGRKESPQLKLMEKQDSSIFFERIKELNEIIVSDELFFNSWNKHLKKERNFYLANLHIDNPYLRAGVIKGLIPHFPYNRNKELLFLNLFRCETHHELMINILSKEVYNK